MPTTAAKKKPAPLKSATRGKPTKSVKTAKRAVAGASSSSAPEFVYQNPFPHG